MSLFKRIAGLFSGGQRRGSDRFLDIYVLSRRCNEPIAGRVDLFNELSLAEEGSGYYARKVLHTSGATRCFDQVEIELWFDKDKRVSEHAVQGGRWLEQADYGAELARFRARLQADDTRVDDASARDSETAAADAPPASERGAE